MPGASLLIQPPPHRFNLAAYALAKGAATPDKVALAILGPDRAENWSYARLRSAVASVAAWIDASGCPIGGRILMRIGNSVEFPVIFLAAIAAGRVPVPTSASLTEVEISRIAAKLSPDLIVADRQTSLPDHPSPVIYSDDLLSNGSEVPLRFVDTRADDPAYIVFTSGSSGHPRGVVHAHRAIWARQTMFDGWYGLRANDRLLHSGALNWTYTLGTGLLDPWTVGATALIPASETPPEQLALLATRHDATIFASVPGIYRKLVREELPAMSALRHGLSAGEKLPEPIRQAWHEKTGTEIHEAFGMSECSTFISGSPDAPAPPDTLGFAQAGRRIAVLGEDGEPDPGLVGSLAIHRSDPGLMIGYLDDPAAEARHLSEDWFVSGDQVAITPDGAIAFHGRSDDVMTSGGFRVSPVEVEQAMTELVEIQEAAAVDLALDRTTSVIAVFYVADRPLDEAKLAGHAASRLADYKRPRKFVHVTNLPRGANGKLLRRLLRNPDRELP